MEQNVQNMTDGQPDRLTYIDVCRGIVIVLMLIGHATPPEFIHKGIYGFHMPFFFILSGMLYDRVKWQQLGVKELVKRRWKAYVIPYFILAFINLLINIPVEYIENIRNRDLLISTLKHAGWIIYSLGNASKMPNCTPLWFLLCLFLCSIIFYYLLQIKKKSMQIFLCFIMSLVAYLLSYFDVMQLPWHIDTALIGVVFMYIGLLLKENGILDYFSHENVSVLLILAVVGSYCIFTNIRIAINTLVIGNIVLMYVGSVAISVFVMAAVKLYMSNNRVLAFYGKNTIMFMAFNYAINTYAQLLWNKLPILASHPFTWWIKVVFDVLGLTIMCVVWNVLKKKFPKIAFF